MIGIIREWLWALLGEYRRSRRDSTAMRRLSSTAERMRIARGVRDFMERNYDLRYNVMKQTEEFRPKNRQDGTCENYDGRNFCYDSRNFCYGNSIKILFLAGLEGGTGFAWVPEVDKGDIVDQITSIPDAIANRRIAIAQLIGNIHFPCVADMHLL